MSRSDSKSPLLGELLESVSRSFFLTLKTLPEDLRELARDLILPALRNPATNPWFQLNGSDAAPLSAQGAELTRQGVAMV